MISQSRVRAFHQWKLRQLAARQRGFIVNPYSFGGGATDPLFSDVISLAHLDGTSGDTGPYDDVVGGAGYWTRHSAGPQLNTSTFKFGTASLNTGLVGCYCADGSEWDFGSDPFTLEGWVYISGNAFTTHSLISKVVAGSYGPFAFLITAGTTYPAFYSSHDGSSWTVAITTTSSLTWDVWYHLAVTRDGSGDHRLFIDGVQMGSTVNATGAVMTNSSVPTIGGESGGTIAWGLNGFIDDFRATRAARYTSNFSPPSAAFPDS